MKDVKLKNKVLELRSKGYTFGEINTALRSRLSKSTISYWCKEIAMDKKSSMRIREIARGNLVVARQKALVVNKIKRAKYLADIYKRNRGAKDVFKNKMVAKISLAILYLAEGGKSCGSVMLGNSDPGIIKLFLRLLNDVYIIDRSKLRCTLQCRADQDVEKLQKFWSKVTNIPLSSFYKVRIDPRTVGKHTIKKDYKGVCRIDYLSMDIFNDLMVVGRILTV